MGFFKKKYQKNVTRDNEFLKDYAIKINARLRYTEENQKVTEALERLQQDFQYTVATNVKDAKKVEKTLADMYDALKATLQQPAWDEQAVLLSIRNMGAEIDEINSMREV